MSDLSDYLRNEVAKCINDIIIAHMLWADDLILISDSSYGLQKQLDGLRQFCSKNMMIVNELKAKVIVFGKRDEKLITFTGVAIHNADSYKYWGNIIRPVNICSGDVF